jgi:hypothetical protein
MITRDRLRAALRHLAPRREDLAPVFIECFRGLAASMRVFIDGGRLTETLARTHQAVRRTEQELRGG